MDPVPSNPVAYFAGTSPAGHPEPFTPEQLSQITHARSRYKKVRRAIAVAASDAWTTAFFAAVSLLGSLLFFSVPGILLGVGMALVSFNSFRGLHAIRRLEPGGATLLGKNQLFLGLCLFLYAAWNLLLIAAGKTHFNLSSLGSTADLSAAGLSSSDLDSLGLGDQSNLIKMIEYGLYGGVAAFAIVVQGLTALYYFSRRKFIAEYLGRTANWVLEMQKMGFKL